VVIALAAPLTAFAAAGGALATRARPGPTTLLVYAVLDDFEPQPRPPDTYSPYNRAGGTRGPIHESDGTLTWGAGQVTATLTSSGFIGLYSSFSHPIAEGPALDFGAVLPPPILARFQPRVTEAVVRVLDGHGTLQLDLQAPDGTFVWSGSVALTGGARQIVLGLPALGPVRNLNWIVSGVAGDFVVMDEVGLTLEAPLDGSTRAPGLWSEAMLLSNWSASSGLTRDRAHFPAGAFDNVSASGLQAAASVTAWRQGWITQASAQAIVQQTAAGLLALPRCHGLLPHFVAGGTIAAGTEWSTVDTVIAWVALIAAQQALGLDTAAAEAAFTGIDWAALLDAGAISHGYDTACATRLAGVWTDFGSESWLAQLGYAASTGDVAAYDSTPPTANGSGFIDELAWLLVPPPAVDRWGTDWSAYRAQAAAAQIDYYAAHACYGPQGLFGLSAAEVPHPSQVGVPDVYQAFGVGGEQPANDGTALLGHAVVVPHYAALAHTLRPAEAEAAWRRLMLDGRFSPLNNTESLMYADLRASRWAREPACAEPVWNDLRGSLNLAFQALGFARAPLQGAHPLYDAVLSNPLLHAAYEVLTTTRRSR
jgi:hypothetical protein